MTDKWFDDSNNIKESRLFLEKYGREFVDHEHCLEVFDQVRRNKNVWNWQSLFFGGVWFLMRRMYMWAIVYFLCELTIMILGINFIDNGTIGLAIAFLAGGVFSLFANRLFYEHVKKCVINKVPGAYIDYIAVSWYFSVYLFIIEISQWLAIDLEGIELNKINFLGPFFPGMVIFAILAKIWQDYNKGDWNIDLPIASVFVMVVLSFIKFQVFTMQMVTNSRMQPNYNNGDFLISTNLLYDDELNKPQVGDVVVIRLPMDRYKIIEPRYVLRRIVGLAGDYIYIKDGILHINKQKVTLDFLYEDITTNGYKKPMRSKYYKESMPWWDISYKVRRHLDIKTDYFDQSKSFLVPKDHIFLISDHRDSISTSAYPFMGIMPAKNIRGKIIMKLFNIQTGKKAHKIQRVTKGLRNQE